MILRGPPPHTVFAPSGWEQMLCPALAGLPLPAIIAAAGVAKPTASGWRSGRHVAHPMYWATLVDLVGVSAQDLIRQVRASSD